MMARLYEELDLRVGDSDDAPSVASIVEQARAAARRDDHARAFRDLIELATNAQDGGLTVVAIELLAELRDLVDLRRVPARERLWLLNLRGRIASSLEDLDTAREQYGTMLERARRLDEPRAASTALQNLGVNALVSGDADAALRYASGSRALKDDIGDSYGAAQVRLNAITALLAAHRPREAERELEEAEIPVRRLRIPGLLCTWYGLRAELAVKRGEFGSALDDYRHALRLARRAHDVEKVAVSMQNLGATYNDLGSPRLALGWYEKALETVAAGGSPGRAEVLLRSRAVTLHRLGKDREARDAFLEAASVAEMLRSHDRALMSAVDAAAVLLNVDETVQARDELEDVLPDVRANAEDSELLVNTLANAAVAHAALGDVGEALSHFREAIEVTETAGLIEQRMALARRAAEAALESDATGASAPEFFELQLETAAHALSPQQRAWEAAEAGALLLGGGQPEAAVGFFGRALATYSRQGNLRLASSVRNDRALARTALGQLRAAHNDLKACLSVADQLHDRVLIQQAQMNLAEVARRLGRYEEALTRGREAIELARSIEDPPAEAQALHNLGLALLDAGDPEAAGTAFSELEDVGRLLKDRSVRSQALHGLADVAKVHGNLSDAASRYRASARLNRREPADQRLDLVALLGVLVEMGAERQIERTLQRVIDLAQEYGMEWAVAEDLVWPASLLRNTDLEGAAQLAAVAILLAANAKVESRSDDPERGEWFRGVAKVLMLIAYTFDAEIEDPDRFWAVVNTEVDAHEEGLAEAMQTMVLEARRVAADQPLNG